MLEVRYAASILVVGGAEVWLGSAEYFAAMFAGGRSAADRMLSGERRWSMATMLRSLPPADTLDGSAQEVGNAHGRGAQALETKRERECAGDERGDGMVHGMVHETVRLLSGREDQVWISARQRMAEVGRVRNPQQEEADSQEGRHENLNGIGRKLKKLRLGSRRRRRGTFEAAARLARVGLSLKRLKLCEGASERPEGATRRRRRRSATTNEMDEEMRMAVYGMKTLCVAGDVHELRSHVDVLGNAGDPGVTAVRGGLGHRPEAHANARAKAIVKAAGTGMVTNCRSFLAACGQRDPG